MDTQEAEVKVTKIISISMACVAFILITGVTSCIMHNDKMDATNTAAKAEYLKVQTDQEKIQGGYSISY